MTTFHDQIKSYAEELGAELKEKKDVLILKKLVAQRTVLFISKKKLTYTCKCRIDKENKTLHFTESLTETGFGFDAGMGVQTETYRTSMKGREGGIKEQNTLFGKKYQYDFDYGQVRNAFEKFSKENEYLFEYHIVGLG